MTRHPTRADAEALDCQDPLAPLRAAFDLPKGTIYLDGNSLGPTTFAAKAALTHAVEQEWSEDLIRSWNSAGWFALPQTLGARLAPLLGAQSEDVLVTDTISLNLFKALHAALALAPGRPKIVAEGQAFPTDLYICEGVARTTPSGSVLLEGRDGPDLVDLVDDQVGVVLINHVDYRTGAVRDMAALTRAVHARGALVVWNLAHSAGALPVALGACDVDFAVGCTYKYLNGGPGAPGFITAASRHHGRLQSPLQGWWGHAAPFAFEPGYRPGPGMAPFLCSTQPILSMRALAGALEVWEGVDMAQVRAKSLSLSTLFIDLVEARCAGHGLRLVSPRDAGARGSQVSWAHPNGYAIVQALIARGVIGDFRTPDLLRFGFAPLYLRHVDIWEAVTHLAQILEEESWRDPRFSVRGVVT